MQTAKKKKSKTRKQFLFLIAITAVPLVQFAIFYVGVNLNSILLAFRYYSFDTGYSFAGFGNFERVFYEIANNALYKTMFVNSLITYVVYVGVGITLALLFSYFIYKKMPLAGVFRIVLFLPSIISSVIMVLLFKYFTESAIPTLLNNFFDIEMSGFLSTTKTAQPVLLFYMVWAGFGPQVLMFTGAMNNISDAVVESAQMDGITPVKEFVFITVPLIWPTFVTFMVVSVAGIFTNQLNLYSFFGTGATTSLWTFGYYLYHQASMSNLPEYPFLAAVGILFTLIAVPLTFLVRWLLEKFGPSAD